MLASTTDARTTEEARGAPAPISETAPRRLWIAGAEALFVEARFRGVTLASRLMRAGPGGGSFAVGATADSDAPVNPAYLPLAAQAQAHALVEALDGGFAVNLTAAMAAQVWSEGDAPPALPPHSGAVVLAAETTLRIWCGEVCFDVQAAGPEAGLPRPWLRAGWRDEVPYPVGVGALLLALLAVVRAIPADARALSLDDIGASTRFDRVLIKPPDAKEPDADRSLAWLRKQGGSGAPAAAGPSGSAGRPDARPHAARVALRGEPTARDAATAAAEVRSHLLLALLDGARSSALAATMSKGPAMGENVREVLANLDGADLENAYGHGGMGPAGTGAKAGGIGDGTIGGDGSLGTLGKFGHGGPGTGVGERYGGAVGRLGTHHPHPPEVIASNATVRGSLDKEIIRRIVRRHLNEVRYCYEQGLARRPGLAGRVVVQFTIAPTGNVLASALATSSLASIPVESCVVGAVKRWAFPAPAGGGLVIVSYPFELTPAGS